MAFQNGWIYAKNLLLIAYMANQQGVPYPFYVSRWESEPKSKLLRLRLSAKLSTIGNKIPSFRSWRSSSRISRSFEIKAKGVLASFSFRTFSKESEWIEIVETDCSIQKKRDRVISDFG